MFGEGSVGLLWFSVVPLGIACVVVLVGAVLRRGIRRTVSMAVSILLFYYLALTLALGLFSMSKQGLFVFSPHFVAGYALALLAVVHVLLHLRNLTGFFALRKTRHSRTRRARFTGGTLVFALLGLLGGLTVSYVLFLKTAGRVTFKIEERCEPTGGPQMSSSAPNPTISFAGRTTSVAEFVIQATSLGTFRLFQDFSFPFSAPPLVYRYSGLMSLPGPRSEASAAEGPRRKDWSLQDLSDLVFYSYGVTKTERYLGGTFHFRAAASAGALYPADVYVFVHSVDALRSGIYYYNPIEHSLDLVVEEPDTQALIDALGMRPTCVPDLVVLVAATFARSSVKYRERGFRYTLMDVGHVLLNVHLAASALGHPHVVSADFYDSELGNLLRLDPARQGVLSAVVFGDLQDECTQAEFSLARLEPSSRAVEAQLSSLLFALTSWERGEDAQLTRSYKALDTPLVKLKRDAFAVIRERRSIRDYSGEPIPLSQLEAVVSAAVSALDLLEAGPLLRVYVLVRRVEGLEEGVYAFGDGRLLRATTSSNFGKIFRASLSQEVVAHASAVVAIVLDKAKLGKKNGARDSRTALISSGVAGQAVYLAATDLGLGACGVGAFYDQDTNEALGLDGDRYSTLYLLTLGAR